MEGVRARGALYILFDRARNSHKSEYILIGNFWLISGAGAPVTQSHLSAMGLYLLDYGAGNVQSLANSLKKLGHDFKWVTEPEDFHRATVSFSG